MYKRRESHKTTYNRVKGLGFRVPECAGTPSGTVGCRELLHRGLGRNRVEGLTVQLRPDPENSTHIVDDRNPALP